MGRKETSGTSNGTSGAPQTSLEQEQFANDMAQAEQKLVQETEEMLFVMVKSFQIKLWCAMVEKVLNENITITVNIK